MRTLSVFNSVSLDGYFCDATGDMSWAHRQDAEWKAFTAENASRGGELLFGRKTFEMMASYWPTALAREHDPALARRMTEMPKTVFSRTLKKTAWANTTIVSSDVAGAVRAMKAAPGPGLAIMGSGTIVALLAQARLVDELQIVVNPLVLGGGRTMFETVRERFALQLVRTRAFSNGNVLLTYAPA